METLIRILHYLSFVKYPVMVLGLYFIYKPFISENSTHFLADTNTGLIFMGVAIGLDSLKDYGRLTWLDKKVYHKPKIAVVFFILTATVISYLIISGIFHYLSASNTALRELSVGFIVFGIGSISVLKAGMLATQDYMKKNREDQKTSDEK